jgi:polysaccharide export outer membrane protein
MTRSYGNLALLLTLVIPRLVTAQVASGDGGGAQTIAAEVGPGDFLVLDIWREPDLSDTLQLDSHGVVVFPKLGPLRVTGIQVDSLERQLVHNYGEYLRNPSIRVTILRRVTIWGSVARPGTYPLDLTMTVTDALALAGGVTPDGKNDKVEIRREGQRRLIDLDHGRRVDVTSLRAGDELFVPQRSWASRNVGLILGAVGTATSLVYLIAR